MSNEPTATPAAPACPAGFDPCICPDAVAQDDDAEFLLDLALTMNDIEAAAVRRIAARLTPDRVTPLVEALRKIVEMADGLPWSTDEEDAILDTANNALRDGGFDA